MEHPREFDELAFFAGVKRYTGLYMGSKSLTRLRAFLDGMYWAFAYGKKEDAFPLFHAFADWYQREVIRDENGYASWCNHMLYVSAYHEELAFDYFFKRFERYLKERYGLELPEPELRLGK